MYNVNQITRVTDEEIRLSVDDCIQKMTRIQEATFWRCYCESLYRVGRPYSQDVCDLITKASHLRLDEFEKAWALNLAQRRIVK